MSASSHDLLQPINAARLFAASLRAGSPEGGETAETLSRIDMALGRAESLIEELREIAHLDSGKQEPRPAAFALDTLLAELHGEYLQLARRKGLRLRLRSSSLWVYSDRRLVYRMLQNLLGNAIKYSRRGKVLLGVRRRRDSLEVQVLDQGPGIAEADHMRVFAEFERLGSGGGEEGLGLGLAIVSRYAKLLDVPLRMASSPGMGSLFSLTLPACEAQAAGGSPDSVPGAVGRLAGTRILCIDNDASVREAMAAIFRSEGCVVRTVAERSALRREFEAFSPELIVADYRLDANDNGIAAVQWVFACSGREVPVILVSAEDREEVGRLAREAGFRLLPKPLHSNRLIALAFALVAQQRAA